MTTYSVYGCNIRAIIVADVVIDSSNRNMQITYKPNTKDLCEVLKCLCARIGVTYEEGKHSDTVDEICRRTGSTVTKLFFMESIIVSRVEQTGAVEREEGNTINDVRVVLDRLAHNKAAEFSEDRPWPNLNRVVQPLQASADEQQRGGDREATLVITASGDLYDRGLVCVAKIERGLDTETFTFNWGGANIHDLGKSIDIVRMESRAEGNWAVTTTIMHMVAINIKRQSTRTEELGRLWTNRSEGICTLVEIGNSRLVIKDNTPIVYNETQRLWLIFQGISIGTFITAIAMWLLPTVNERVLSTIIATLSALLQGIAAYVREREAIVLEGNTCIIRGKKPIRVYTTTDRTLYSIGEIGGVWFGKNPSNQQAVKLKFERDMGFRELAAFGDNYTVSIVRIGHTVCRHTKSMDASVMNDYTTMYVGGPRTYLPQRDVGTVRDVQITLDTMKMIYPTVWEEIIRTPIGPDHLPKNLVGNVGIMEARVEIDRNIRINEQAVATTRWTNRIIEPVLVPTQLHTLFRTNLTWDLNKQGTHLERML